MSTLVKLEVSNCKRISFAEVDLEGNLVKIGGMNEQGKSSLMDSIRYLYGGAKAMPPMPLRKGEDAGYIKGVEDNGWVTIRKFGKGTTLEVRNEKGVLQKKPQDICDAKCGAISFDPLEFARMPKPKQGETLRQLKGIDNSDLDEQKLELESERTLIGRQVKSLKGELEGVKPSAIEATEEVSAAGLSAELERRVQVNMDNDFKRERLKEVATEYRGIQAEIDALTANLKHLEEEGQKLKVEVPELKDEDAEEIREQLSKVDEVNAAVRENKRGAEIKSKLALQAEAYEAHSTELEDIKQQRRDRLSATPWPIEGLGMDEDGNVTYKDLPFDEDQLSSKQIARVSAAIGFSLAPEPEMLKVMLIRNGSLFDSESLAELAEEAKRIGWLILVEIVTDKDADIIVEDGMVKKKRGSK